MVRQLIEKVRLVPEGNTLNIELFGELAALLSLGIGPNDNYPLANAKGVQVTLVAGAGFRLAPGVNEIMHPYLHPSIWLSRSEVQVRRSAISNAQAFHCKTNKTKQS